jgi:hypothetical protein
MVLDVTAEQSSFMLIIFIIIMQFICVDVILSFSAVTSF